MRTYPTRDDELLHEFVKAIRRWYSLFHPNYASDRYVPISEIDYVTKYVKSSPASVFYVMFPAQPTRQISYTKWREEGCPGSQYPTITS